MGGRGIRRVDGQTDGRTDGWMDAGMDGPRGLTQADRLAGSQSVS